MRPCHGSWQSAARSSGRLKATLQTICQIEVWAEGPVRASQRGRQVGSLLEAMDLDDDGFVDQNEFIQYAARLPSPASAPGAWQTCPKQAFPPLHCPGPASCGGVGRAVPTAFLCFRCPLHPLSHFTIPPTLDFCALSTPPAVPPP